MKQHLFDPIWTGVSVETVFEAWNSIPTLWKNGPIFALIPEREKPLESAADHARNIVIEHSLVDANQYWSCARVDASDKAAVPNHPLLDFLSFERRLPRTPFAWAHFPSYVGHKEEVERLRYTRDVFFACRDRLTREFREDKERWSNTGRRIGEAIGTSAFDAILEIAADQDFLSRDTLADVSKGNTVTDVIDTAVDAIEAFSAEDRDAAVERAAAYLAKECLSVVKDVSFAAQPVRCDRPKSSVPLFQTAKAPLLVSVERLEWQGIGCLEFLRSIIAQCGDASWPVLIVASTSDFETAERILGHNLHRTASTCKDIRARIFVARVAAVKASATEDAAALDAEAQAFFAECNTGTYDEGATDAGSLSMARPIRAASLRNRTLQVWRVSKEPRLIDVSLALLGLAMMSTNKESLRGCERVSLLESAGLPSQAAVEIGCVDELPEQFRDMIIGMETVRLEDLGSLYSDCDSLEDLRRLCSEDGPICALASFLKKYSLPVGEMWSVVESYLFSVSRLRPAATESGEIRFAWLAEAAAEEDPESRPDIQLGRLIRKGQAQLYMRRLEEAEEALQQAVRFTESNTTIETSAWPRKRLAASLLDKVRTMRRKAERDLHGGGITKQTLKLFAGLWGLR